MKNYIVGGSIALFMAGFLGAFYFVLFPNSKTTMNVVDDNVSSQQNNKNMNIMEIQDIEIDKEKSEKNETEDTFKAKLFYHNNKKDPNIEECNVNDFLEVELPMTQMNAQGLVDYLLNFKPNDDDLISSFPSGATKPMGDLKIEELRMENGILYLSVDDPDYFTSGGSCWVGILSTQITETLNQLENIQEVRFEGVQDYVFQP